jgi:hypothetical protein
MVENRCHIGSRARFVRRTSGPPGFTARRAGRQPPLPRSSRYRGRLPHEGANPGAQGQPTADQRGPGTRRGRRIEALCHGQHRSRFRRLARGSRLRGDAEAHRLHRQSPRFAAGRRLAAVRSRRPEHRQRNPRSGLGRSRCPGRGERTRRRAGASGGRRPGEERVGEEEHGHHGQGDPLEVLPASHVRTCVAEWRHGLAMYVFHGDRTRAGLYGLP